MVVKGQNRPGACFQNRLLNSISAQMSRKPIFNEVNDGAGSISLNTDPRIISRETRSQSGKPLRMVHLETHEYVEDGDDFDIPAEKREDLLDLQLLRFRYMLSIAMSQSDEGMDEDE
ncbi:hypothetical protein CORC01_07623 [Colletotrichum orchidophilum]|uniref:Uncharacterized protein n=1 Tax=Colletotrichum orchidophilum TaxID=1209926 RepID=A0A1G4B6J0_9PEZI|nr:uncharacterized protein CORC01_07623 [Colletotrichum orchidophilum]OHE97014.1 hypothetical protein CORC01_07623 [Colletotrichum orchidophilum]